jgi:ubiquinone/menaquinone biosynthesis C-methylase UbiE
MSELALFRLYHRPALPLPSEIYDRDYYLSDRVEGWEQFQEGGLSAIKQQELRLLGLRPGIRLLDAGCGRGEALRAAASAGAKVAGIDFSEAAVEVARETLADVPGVDVQRCDVAEIPWPDASFDRILFADVIEHLDAEHRHSALGELHRVLRPGGALLVHTAPNRLFTTVAWPLARPLLRAAGRGRAAASVDFWIEDTRRYHAEEMTLHGLRREMHSAGFESPRVWIDPNVIRVGQGHHLTRELEGNPIMRLAGRVAGLRPLRLFLGNDIYALGERRS